MKQPLLPRIENNIEIRIHDMLLDALHLEILKEMWNL